jgi:hypothetical protein
VFKERGVSPEDLSGAVVDLITTAQAGGIVRRDVDAETVALLIIGACHQAALHAHLAGQEHGSPSDPERRLAGTLETLLQPG